MFRDDIALLLAGLTGVCLLILAGGYVYSGGEIWPSADDGADSWLFSILLFAIPVATAADLLVRGVRRLRNGKRRV